MKTEIFSMSESKVNIDSIEKCAKIIKSGGLVAYPTETVYGLGANALDAQACYNIYIAKQRPETKGLICNLFDVSQAESIAYVDDRAKRLWEAFAPGPLTVVLRKKSCICDIVSGGLETVAMRFPSNPIFRALGKAANVPIATPSANISGKPAPTASLSVINDFDGIIDAIIDAGETGGGVPSTIVSLIDADARILRIGAISPSEVQRYVTIK